MTQTVIKKIYTAVNVHSVKPLAETSRRVSWRKPPPPPSTLPPLLCTPTIHPITFSTGSPQNQEPITSQDPCHIPYPASRKSSTPLNAKPPVMNTRSKVDASVNKPPFASNQSYQFQEQLRHLVWMGDCNCNLEKKESLEEPNVAS